MTRFSNIAVNSGLSPVSPGAVPRYLRAIDAAAVHITKSWDSPHAGTVLNVASLSNFSDVRKVFNFVLNYLSRVTQPMATSGGATL